MAEFQEVIRQAVRMCRGHVGCVDCPMKSIAAGRCPICRFVDINGISEDVERIVMAWAAEHPEPVYPSWKDAWKQLFPHGQGSPCPVAYGMEFEPEGCGGISCVECKARPMHAKVAEKLGIKPVEGKNDENA